MAGLNRCQFIGTLIGDPEVRKTPAGCPVVIFFLACNKHVVLHGARKEATELVSIMAGDKQDKSCKELLVKGDLVYVEGYVHTRTMDTEDGKRHFRTEIVATQVIFLNKTKKGGRAASSAPEEIPF